jgi:hypothetical protein
LLYPRSGFLSWAKGESLNNSLPGKIKRGAQGLVRKGATPASQLV